MINSNLSPISHRLATIHPGRTGRQTDGRTDDNQDNSSNVT